MLLCSLMLAAMPVMAETVEGKGDCSVLMCNEMIECRIEGANRSYKVEGNTITVGVSGVSGIPFGYSSVATITLTNRTDTDGKISFGWAEVKDDPVNSLKMSKEDEYGYKEINKTGFIEK